jgi:uncharacterized membrane protein YphA (DoxX/SURF4 family)
MKTVLRAVPQVLLGVVLVFTGLNKLFWFVPMPPMSPALTTFMSALKATGYFLPFLGVVEFVGGLLLLLNRFVPLAITIIAPVVVNILAVHSFLDASARALTTALTLVALEIYLAWVNREAFRSLFVARGIDASKKLEAGQWKRTGAAWYDQEIGS